MKWFCKVYGRVIHLLGPSVRQLRLTYLVTSRSTELVLQRDVVGESDKMHNLPSVLTKFTAAKPDTSSLLNLFC